MSNGNSNFGYFPIGAFTIIALELRTWFNIKGCN